MQNFSSTHDCSHLERAKFELPLEKYRLLKICRFDMVVVFLLAIASGFLYAITLSSISFKVLHWQPSSQSTIETSTCSELSIRREWRTLSMTQRLEYITAVQCLLELPSEFGLDQPLYQDFPYIHSLMGNSSHGKLAFLPWHRYFLHVYETALREKCGYQGHLTYWDWTLDWEDLRNAPVWDSVHGFGGDGNSSAEKSVAYGHCVTDGPFANLELLYFGNPGKDHKHCLSRGFISIEEAQRRAPLISPAHVNEILGISEYADFFLKLEFDSHNSLPNFIRGEFYEFTAPNDPVFYLHHAQLDRLWLKWQLLDEKNRIKKLSSSLGGDILEEVLDMGALAKRVHIAQVLDSQSELFCYSY